jgi:NAD(P)-dependent dehydrogenase (short-subunit alcohol dehydrogenase family)
MNRTVLITGGSRGLGRCAADFLAAQRYDLVITSRGEEELAAAARWLRRHGGQVIALAGDVADPDHRRRLGDAARGLGRLDILLNNASTLGATPLPPLAEYPPGDLEEAFRVNVTAPLALAAEVLPLLERSGGLVVNISSDAARGGYPGWGGYGLTKAALDLASLTLPMSCPAAGSAWWPWIRAICARACTRRRSRARTSPTVRCRRSRCRSGPGSSGSPARR